MLVIVDAIHEKILTLSSCQFYILIIHLYVYDIRLTPNNLNMHDLGTNVIPASMAQSVSVSAQPNDPDASH